MKACKFFQSVNNKKNFLVASFVIASGIAIADLPAAKADTTARLASSNRVNIQPAVNGVYLYGESDRPDVEDKEYIVFETSDTKTIGAVYLPQSEFSCFYGQFKNSRLNVTLIDEFELKKQKLTLSLTPQGLTASNQTIVSEPVYKPLVKIDEKDLKIIEACKLQLYGKKP